MPAGSTPTISWSAQLEAPGGSASEGFLLTEVTATPDGGSEPHRYFLPLDYVWGEQHIGFGSPYLSYTLAKIRRGPRIGIVYDAAQGDFLAQAIVHNMRARHAIDSEGARLTFLGSDGLDQLQEPETPSVRRIGVEQSNTSMIVNEQLVLKLYRRLQSGVQPEVEMARFLTEVAGFANTPAYLGSMQRHRQKAARKQRSASPSALVPNQGDGWNYTVDWLRRFMEEDRPSNGLGEHDEAGVLFAEYAGLAETLGTRTAELHRSPGCRRPTTRRLPASRLVPTTWRPGGTACMSSTRLPAPPCGARWADRGAAPRQGRSRAGERTADRPAHRRAHVCTRSMRSRPASTATTTSARCWCRTTTSSSSTSRASRRARWSSGARSPRR
jgi:hypothetical protein